MGDGPTVAAGGLPPGDTDAQSGPPRLVASPGGWGSPVTSNGGQRPNVVLVDDVGHPTGLVSWSQVHGDEPVLHLGFSALLVDDDGRVLVARRDDPSGQPPAWGASLHGHPGPAEPVEHAAARAAEQDFGLRLVGLRPVLPLFRYRSVIAGIPEYELCPVFVGRAIGEPVCGPGVLDIDWVPWPQLRDEVLFARRPATGSAIGQIAAMCRFPDDPTTWPAGPVADLPPALRYTGRLDGQSSAALAPGAAAVLRAAGPLESAASASSVTGPRLQGPGRKH